jgi:protein-S-isoprenylcysteine O-methyltransferase Ste14
MRPGIVIILLWAVFAISWLLAAFWSGATEKRAGIGAEAASRMVLILGGLVLAMPAHGYTGPLRLWHVGWTQAWICVGLEAAAFAFCWWARIHLGPLWSASVTRKADHRVVESGPYGIVRHPIYAGILLAVFATAAAKGTIPGLAGAAIISLGFWMKARLEERWLRQELGPETYEAYRRKVPMLVPFGPKST